MSSQSFVQARPNDVGTTVQDSTQPLGRVLVVDDEPTLVKGYLRVLGKAGYEAEAASNGLEALQCWERGEFDLIVSDISMPGMTGLELLRAVRRRDVDMPVILVTGGPTVDSAIQAVEEGAMRYLLKPLDPDELLRSVERAVRMRRAAWLKHRALGMLSEFERTHGSLLGIEELFQRALRGLFLAYQPIVAWSQKRIFGYEALVRSSEPQMGNPGALFDAAERIGRLRDLCHAIRDKAAQRFMNDPQSYRLFINLHVQELEDESLFDSQQMLSQIASRVVLEITERSSLSSIRDARAKVAKLREMGFRIALDDLGAGYAGLTSFTVLDPDVVKLDMSLVRDVHLSVTKQRLVRSVTHLCSEMGLDVIAEGVETAEERDALIELGCDLFQGYYFARPSPDLISLDFSE